MPVISHNGYQNILNPFTGNVMGTLHVLLAMGSQRQIGKLSGHYDKVIHKEMALADSTAVVSVDHCFDITVGRAEGVRMLDEKGTSEVDCFVQFQFSSGTAETNLGKKFGVRINMVRGGYEGVRINMVRGGYEGVRINMVRGGYEGGTTKYGTRRVRGGYLC